MHSLWDSLGKLLIDFSQHILLIFIGLRLFVFFLEYCHIIIKIFL